ncbi:putative electron transfer flavoprotein FixA [Campylobacter sp. 19-13652]|uniref:putative electron transfer flavoprotein FixA n=1 Tax=Campylobacter sp. 19-13652 TaxID=2840180 RepID=UPI001C798D7A|nr:putative electron transfer flavoprotein FixA [Campylobacter sp. 19-13652]BCX80152.1 protein FixA [Campylobacter sp. 19-13652]
MNILVCCKVVPQEQDIAINADRTLNLSNAGGKISQFDLNAIQAGVDIKASLSEAKLIGLSVGGELANSPKIKKDLLSRGLDELFLSTQSDILPPSDTACVLAAMANQTGYSLIICGDGSGDFYSSQVGMRLGAKLGIAAISGVSEIVSVDESRVVVLRELENETQKLELALPALLCVSTDINTPTIPGMKAILAASKKPASELSVSLNAAGDVEILSIKAPARKQRLGVIVKGDSDEMIDKFIQNIKHVVMAE